jgi:ATP-binding cassette, subfamily B (MDR/TAP), member 1
MTSKASGMLANEKGGQKTPFSFLQQKAKIDDKALRSPDSGSDDGANTVVAKAVNADGNSKADTKESAPLVPFFSLYRFHTKYELALNFIGLICAAASGAAQVSPGISLMTAS